HWRYKEHNSKQSEILERMNWFKKTLENESSIKDNEKFIDTFKTDLGTGSIWVFTPKRKPIELPEKASPIDFAYAIHTKVGNSCTGAVVNGKMVPLSFELSTGDVVEIITSQNAKGPSLDWLNYAKSSSTRNRIRQYFKQQSKETNIKLGRDILELEAKKCGYHLDDLLSEIDMNELTKRFNLLSLDDVFASIGYGGITAKQALGKVISERKYKERQARRAEILAKTSTNKTNDYGAVIVDGISNMPVRFGGCCKPIAGDDIVGFVSHTRGITIHRADCKNAKNISGEKQVKVEWKEGKRQLFNVTMSVLCKDNGLALSKITTALASIKVNVVSISSKPSSDNLVLVTLVVQVEDRQQERGIKAKLKQTEYVFEVR
ncbi:MAG: bifunctional (p)ppGpp synthetase/guanosine-3',5'-bis(diphosphate) 3'-pyrophosphohydrolase, partial [Clostridia bacterium]|nr:bifunctional (p)ppGpp synthetase/guanosine-3',5'-bis(diphosphate) 3'-pyrophosphohydrolase [Clostridia bacterium]